MAIAGVLSYFCGMKPNTPKVLVAPLEWGLGHATRCIPIIRELVSLGAEVTICANGSCKVLLEKEFPSLKMIEIPGFFIQYPENGSMALSMIGQIPTLLSAIRIEHRLLEEEILKHGFTHVISDNRYGLYTNSAKTTFITHQVHIKGGKSFKFIESLIFRINKKLIERFDELWIPDVINTPNLSGTLSESSRINIPVHQIGILSRFTPSVAMNENKYDIIALLSGPEPQRSVFESKVRKHFAGLNKKCLIIQGLPAKTEKEKINDVEVVPSITTEELTSILHPETLLISRPGYSTIMDMAILGHRKILFVPTPGQTEQDYLADYLQRIYNYRYILQKDKFPDDEVEEGKQLPVNIPNELLTASLKKFLA